jgi:uncharacterized protein YjbI with pentapeptide repeats
VAQNEKPPLRRHRKLLWLAIGGVTLSVMLFIAGVALSTELPFPAVLLGLTPSELVGPIVLVLVLLALLMRAARTQAWTGFGDKTLWDWLQLLIVPLVLVGGGFLFSTAQDNRQLAIEDQRAQDTALQGYLDQMSELILQKDLLESEGADPAYTLAQARTSTVILRLDAEHNESVIHFLNNSGLTGRGKSSVSILRGIELKNAQLGRANLPEADLSGAHMNSADLRWAHLHGTNLSDAFLNFAELNHADLSDANLESAYMNDANLESAYMNDANLPEAHLGEADLMYATLSDANLNSANLNSADLSDADLSDANLSDAYVGYVDLSVANLGSANLDNANLISTNLSESTLPKADLSGAYLAGADLSGANITGADLSGANLNYADLSDARGVTEEQLEDQAQSLDGATMPDGSKHP